MHYHSIYVEASDISEPIRGEVLSVFFQGDFFTQFWQDAQRTS